MHHFDNSLHSLYIHWPFCPYKCHFCPFVAIASHDEFMPAYHDALTAEIQKFAHYYAHRFSIETIFFGGGTPSTYPPHLLLDMFATLRREFDCSPSGEITIEVNPGTVTSDLLMTWKEVGINRLSIGVQSLDDSILQGLNRHQKARDVRWLIQEAAPLFDSISIDLILGLPGVSPAAWKNLLHEVVQWPIRHISLYFLTVHEDTPLYFKVKTGRIQLPQDEEMIALYHWSVDYLELHGLHRYELSNFAKPGYESRHNSVYWDRRAYKGFGLGACSFDGMQRFQNEKNLTRYIEGMRNDCDVNSFTEQLTNKQVYLEKIMLGLRRKKGISLSEVSHYLTASEQEQFMDIVTMLNNEHLISMTADTVVLTTSGLMVENEIIARLLR